jgi:hypothetical protein
MTFKKQGKRSKAWWLQTVKDFGVQGMPGIMRGGEIATWHVKDAIMSLKSSGCIRIEGDMGRGRKPKIYLTDLGNHYLENNQQELKESEAGEPERVYSWRRVSEGANVGDIQFLLNSRVINKSDVPAAEGLRLAAEIAASPKPEHAAAISFGERHSVPASPVWSPVPLNIAGDKILEPSPAATPLPANDKPKPQEQAGGGITQKSFREAFRGVLQEILFERYGDQVTAKEVMERLEANE